MRLTIINGSPKGRGSNTRVLTDKFIEGFNSVDGNRIEEYFLNGIKQAEEQRKIFTGAEQIILAHPLYTDAMPSIVKEFIENLSEYKNRDDNPPVGIIIQSGFTESIHSEYVAAWYKKLCKRLGCEYKGTVIRGGVEGVKIKPPFMTRKLLDMFYRLGIYFGKTGEFDKKLVRKLAKPRKLSFMARGVIRLMEVTGLLNFYWNSLLKKNNSYEKRFDRPYAKEK